MTRTLHLILVAGLILALNSSHAQQATERYIPIGESPGVTDSVIGTITAVNYDDHSMTVRSDAGVKTVRMVDSTRYYIDRTRARSSNRSASLSDCRVGLRVEVKYGDDSVADWVKIEESD